MTSSAALTSRFRSAPVDDNCSDLNQVVARAEQSIAAVTGQQVRVSFALSPNVPRVAVPSGELERIVCGLCAAARSQLAPGSRMVIETRAVNDAPLGASVAAAPAGEERARLIVRAECLAQSSPLATQAPSAPHPAPLADSALEELLERLGGRLEFVSSSNAEFAYVAHLPHAAGARSSGRMAVAVTQDAGVILLVEDEPQVQAVTARILRAFGYPVLTAHNERTALAQAEQYGSAIGLVVSDLVLPGVSGKDLVRRLRQPCEHAQVLYISGYSPEHVGALTDGACFLRKPFTAQELLGVVRTLLPESVH
jgi:CheY-like chemotaxis protein